MTERNIIRLCILALTITTGSVQADRIYFTGQGGDDSWTNANNWVYYKSNPIRTGIPNDIDDARLQAEKTVKITTAVTAGYLKVGVNGTSKVILDGGSLVTVGTADYNSVDYNSAGSIIVQNGGYALFNARLFVGYLNSTGGSLVIHDGTVRVANTFFHNKDYSGTDALNTRTTINPDGLLDVDTLTLNAGVIDVAGGTLIVRQARGVEQWVADGRMIAMGGAAGWKIKAIVDADTGWTIIIAEPVTESSNVGMLNNPASPVSLPLPD